MLYNVTAMKQYQQLNYTAKETAVQVVLPLDVETIIPEDDSVRTLMRMAERINYTKLSGAYARENPRETRAELYADSALFAANQGRD